MGYGPSIMALRKSPELQSFFTTYFSSADPENDLQTAQSFISSSTAEKQSQVILQAKELLNSDALVEVLGMEANRWFGDAEEARDWMGKILGLLNSADHSDSVVVKDSNGASLSEGDAVTVIKDLNVKGGSSDLKRGTLIKKIHLIGDPDNIECNVNGSTLVLKTCFLKKA